LATGNFNETTSHFYTDHVLFTANSEFSQELEQLFFYLQSRMQPKEYGKLKFNHLLVSQFNMVRQFRKKIEREMEHARAGRPAHIIIKLNNLQERDMINYLYAASNAGVKIQLLIRSICCLDPGVPGQSENITVHRIVDKYLEHARVFMFFNNGQTEFYMGSADWMNRNLHSRVEVIFPINDRGLCEEINHILQLQLSDNKKAVYFKSDLSNERIISKSNEPVISAQDEIYRFVKSLKD
jgi:polyphosphate kinase